MLRLHGWKIIDKVGMSSLKKCVMVAAPHTSNWDYYYTMLMFFGLGIKFKFLAKVSLFKFPFKWIMEVTGGIPVDRTKSNFLIPRMTKLFAEVEEMSLLIAVEGTRSYAKQWKPGFYHIAKGAGVPVACGFLDYSKRTGGFLGTIMPTGDYEADLVLIQELYKGIEGKNVKQFAQG
jgi:1-acyl-sn-glycerol-3-phosphate acyltransferase